NQRIPEIKIEKVKKSSKIAVVTAIWNQDLTDKMLSECMLTLTSYGLKPTSIRVSGSFELVAATKNAFLKKFDAVIALGVVLRGETPHFDYVAMAVTNGLTQIAAETGKPIGFGVLTCDNYDQAKARAGFPGSIENKGRESALAVLQSLNEHKKLG
ncbi:MAG: 6,7-dimethyl-8-ribityllumazine synthase, partial [Actinomycetota bacterium]